MHVAKVSEANLNKNGYYYRLYLEAQIYNNDIDILPDIHWLYSLYKKDITESAFYLSTGVNVEEGERPLSDLESSLIEGNVISIRGLESKLIELGMVFSGLDGEVKNEPYEKVW